MPAALFGRGCSHEARNLQGVPRDGALRSPEQIATAIRFIVAGEYGGGERLVAANICSHIQA